MPNCSLRPRGHGHRRLHRQPRTGRPPLRTRLGHPHGRCPHRRPRPHRRCWCRRPGWAQQWAPGRRPAPRRQRELPLRPAEAAATTAEPPRKAPPREAPPEAARPRPSPPRRRSARPWLLGSVRVRERRARTHAAGQGTGPTARGPPHTQPHTEPEPKRHNVHAVHPRREVEGADHSLAQTALAPIQQNDPNAAAAAIPSISQLQREREDRCICAQAKQGYHANLCRLA